MAKNPGMFHAFVFLKRKLQQHLENHKHFFLNSSSEELEAKSNKKLKHTVDTHFSEN
jgi:5S rRNA maturation endonuclease (ribonuclease M5)